MNKQITVLTSFAKIICTGIHLFLCFSSMAQTGGSTRITFTIRDQNTGFAVWGATVTATAPDGSIRTSTANANGKLVFEAKSGRYNFSINTEGYKPLETFFETGAASAIEADIPLEPTMGSTTGQEAKTVAIQQSVIIQGYVRDATANIPLAGVAVQVGHATAITNGMGYFSINATSLATCIEAGHVPEKIAVHFSKAGYMAFSIQKMYTVAGKYNVQVALMADGNGQELTLH